MKARGYYLWATWFSSGYAPLAAGSLAALPFIWFIAGFGKMELIVYPFLIMILFQMIFKKKIRWVQIL